MLLNGFTVLCNVIRLRTVRTIFACLICVAQVKLLMSPLSFETEQIQCGSGSVEFHVSDLQNGRNAVLFSGSDWRFCL